MPREIAARLLEVTGITAPAPCGPACDCVADDTALLLMTARYPPICTVLAGF